MTEKYLHPFPARMAPEIALQELRRSPAGSIVVDPMVGSGTSVRVAASCGLDAWGFDIDPLAVRLARAESSRIDGFSVNKAGLAALGKLSEFDRRTLPRYPEWFDDETKAFADRWFPRYNQTVLAFLAEKLAAVRDEQVRNMLEVVLSSTIIVKEGGCSFARDAAHSRPHMHHEYEPKRAEVLFRERLTRAKKILERRSDALKCAATVSPGDCRKLPLPGGFADVVITSPPYLNALDYMRGHRLALIWFGFKLEDLRKTRATSIGTERAGEAAAKTRQEALQARYTLDMTSMVREVHRILKPQGRFICVVGDNQPHVGLSNAALVRSLAKKHGLNFMERRRRAIPKAKRYLPPPNGGTSALDARMVWESIITFHKP